MNCSFTVFTVTENSLQLLLLVVSKDRQDVEDYSVNVFIHVILKQIVASSAVLQSVHHYPVTIFVVGKKY